MQNAYSSPYYKLLIGGDYQAIVSEAMDKSLQAPSPDDLPWIIGALTFLGRSREAKGLFQARAQELEGSSRVAARFFLAVAHCREGSFAASTKALLENAGEARKNKDAISLFFHYQGFAFYRYSTGRLSRAQVWAEAALSTASGASFAYGASLAYELLGHIQLSSGQFHAGFRQLEFAKEKASLLGQGALYQAIEISTVLYKASYGIARKSSELLDMLDTFTSAEHFQDSYTQAALNLEIARIYILRGELHKAKDQLEATSELVYKINNPDLEMDYNLQLAQLLRGRGESHQALSLVRSAKHRVMDGQDARSRLKVLGFESQLLKALERFPEQEALIPELSRLSRLCGSLMAERYQARYLSTATARIRGGEDLLGDLIDRVAQYQEAVVGDILRGEWYSLLASPLNVLPSENVLYFDAEPGSLTIFQKGDVQHIQDGCSTSIRNLLVLLSQRPCSKETLANQLWRQSYNPLRHDGLIYPLIAKARKCLGRASDWIEAYEFGYRLRDGVRVAASHALESAKAEKDESEDSADSALNPRQKMILDIMGRGEEVEPRALVKKLAVSDATISRDMSALIDLGLAKRIGRGRATRYSLETPFIQGERP